MQNIWWIKLFCLPLQYRKQQTTHLEQKSRLTKQALKIMQVNIQIAIMSHLSDAQSIMNADSVMANTHINFAKRLIMKYDNTEVYAEEEELDAIWEEEYNRLHEPEAL